VRDIKVLHLEPTNVCQAACSLCARETDVNFDKLQRHQLDMQKILKVFSAEHIAKLDKMFMCGVYGDPAAGTNTLEIYQEFRQLNLDIVLGMNTNGAIQNTAWWHELATVFNQPQDYVVFSIDGLEDTNHVYRKNVDWHKLMANAQSYILAGGSAHWDMLVYQHNEHQVDACEQLARDLGFTWFRAKVSKRGFNDQLQQPINWTVPQVFSTKINCHALNEKSAYIDCEGKIGACCWLGGWKQDFSNKFDSIKKSWTTDQPEFTCRQVCGTTTGTTSFSNQWQKNVQL
jgi:sulfatase maturation enzyme AslB (radical SAM superfamily)